MGSRRTVRTVGAAGAAGTPLGGCATSASTDVSTISSEPSPISDLSGLEARSFFKILISSLRAALASSRALSSVWCLSLSSSSILVCSSPRYFSSKPFSNCARFLFHRTEIISFFRFWSHSIRMFTSTFLMALA